VTYILWSISSGSLREERVNCMWPTAFVSPKTNASHNGLIEKQLKEKTDKVDM
jgi:hypothetical protein